MTNTRAERHRCLRWDVLSWVGLAFWFVGFLWNLSRESLWLLDLVVIPLTTTMYLLGFVAAIVGIAANRRWVAALSLIPVLVVLTLLVNPAWMIAPRAWFMLHRPLFTMALDTDPGRDYYGNELPLPLRFLTAEGKVSTMRIASGGVHHPDSRFFPQWIGIPDDAGGYLYDPGQSPEGADLYGDICEHPVDLGDGWWMCGLRDNGL
jgi:hypothetical protein